VILTEPDVATETSTPTPLRVAVIIASTRAGRFGETVGRWFVEQANTAPGIEVDVIDMIETPLPADLGGGPEVDAFRARIGAADGFIVITPEYNHSFPAHLKHAIDSVKAEWKAKPVGFVSYGGLSGGLRAVEHLRLVFAELHMVSIRDAVSFHNARSQFDEQGQPVDAENVNKIAAYVLAELAWWADALKAARARSEYPG